MNSNVQKKSLPSVSFFLSLPIMSHYKAGWEHAHISDTEDRRYFLHALVKNQANLCCRRYRRGQKRWDTHTAHSGFPLKGEISPISYEMLEPLKGKSSLNYLLPGVLHISGSVCSVPMLSWPSDQQNDIQCEHAARCHYSLPISRGKQSHMPPSVTGTPLPAHRNVLHFMHNWGNVFCQIILNQALRNNLGQVKCGVRGPRYQMFISKALCPHLKNVKECKRAKG